MWNRKVSIPKFLNWRRLKKLLLILTFRMYPVLYDMPLKDYKNEKVKANVWDKIAREMRVSGHNVSGTLTFSTSNPGNRLVRPWI